jgi:hypothetical protein
MFHPLMHYLFAAAVEDESFYLWIVQHNLDHGWRHGTNHVFFDVTHAVPFFFVIILEVVGRIQMVGIPYSVQYFV